MYIVLARKYRSQTFDDVVGQEAIAQTLKNAIKTGRVAHAYLFTGTRGIGKTTMARILAKALNCLSVKEPTTEPCCKCDSCVAINAGEDIDVIEIDGASNNSVENIRELNQNSIYRPARSRFKIYIVDEVHMLSVSAFNALLKTLEEPPEHIKFIFATTEPNKVIPTIQSRCQRFDFNNIAPRLIADRLKEILKKEKISFEDDFIIALSKMADGSMRDALSLLDRLISIGKYPLTLSLLEEYLGAPDSEKIYNLLSELGDSNAAGTLEAADKLLTGGFSEVQIVDTLIDSFRDLMLIKTAGADSKLLTLTKQQVERSEKLCEKFDIAALIYNITSLEKLRWTIKNTENSRPLLEAMLLRFALAEHFLNVERLGSRADTDIKKNKIVNNPPTKVSPEPLKSAVNPSEPQLKLTDIQSVKDNWEKILDSLIPKLGSSTTGMLSRAQPSKLEGNVLTIAFDASAKMQKAMCESNGRLEQIQSALSEYFSSSFAIEFELSTNDSSRQSRKAASKQRENEIMNDPAVRTVLSELGATITDIEKSNP